MPKAPRYRLEPIERLRKAESTAAARELARAEAALAHAREAREGTQRALDRHVNAGVMRAAQPVPRGRTVRGIDLQRAAAYAARHSTIARELRAALAEADARVAECEARVARCRIALAAAHAGAQVMERDRERFEREARRQAEHAEQLELEEQRPAIRGGRKRVRSE